MLRETRAPAPKRVLLWIDRKGMKRGEREKFERGELSLITKLSLSHSRTFYERKRV